MPESAINRGVFSTMVGTCQNVGSYMQMIHLTSAIDVGELAIIKSLLDGNRIAYVVHGEHVSSLYPGLPFFVSKIMVHASDQARAAILLSRLRLSIREASA